MKLLQALPEKVVEGRNACLKNAENMLTASRVVFEQRLFNIAYHLGVVALEEIGKACMLAMSGMKELEEEDRNLKHIDDHVKKIFWALFDISFCSEPLTKKSLDQNTQIAHVIHDLRLRSMYVDVTEAGITTPEPPLRKNRPKTL